MSIPSRLTDEPQTSACHLYYDHHRRWHRHGPQPWPDPAPSRSTSVRTAERGGPSGWTRRGQSGRPWPLGTLPPPRHHHLHYEYFHRHQRRRQRRLCAPGCSCGPWQWPRWPCGERRLPSWRYCTMPIGGQWRPRRSRPSDGSSCAWLWCRCCLPRRMDCGAAARRTHRILRRHFRCCCCLLVPGRQSAAAWQRSLLATLLPWLTEQWAGVWLSVVGPGGGQQRAASARRA